MTYNTLIDGLCKKGEIDKEMDFLQDMISKGFAPNMVTYNTLIDGTVLLVQVLVPATGAVPTFTSKGLKFRIEKSEIITKTCIVDYVLFKLKYLC